jgi:hypothetical protein
MWSVLCHFAFFRSSSGWLDGWMALVREQPHLDREVILDMRMCKIHGTNKMLAGWLLFACVIVHVIEPEICLEAGTSVGVEISSFEFMDAFLTELHGHFLYSSLMKATSDWSRFRIIR